MSNRLPLGPINAGLRSLYYRLPLATRRRLRRIRRQHLKPLRETLPLSVPETIHLDPTNLCNFKCTFCPTGDRALLKSVGRPIGQMKLGLFQKIVDDLADMIERYDARPALLHLYKDGEPLLNKQFPEMARYAKQRDVARVVSTTSNGALITEELAAKIAESGLDNIRISVEHVSDKGYEDITLTFSDYEKIRRNVETLFRAKQRAKSSLRVFVKITDTGLRPEEKKKFEEDFGPIADMLTIGTLMGWSMSEVKDFTLGMSPATGMDSVSPLRERAVCPEPFSRLAVNFDGQVSVCCVDWSFGTIVGDLKTNTLDEIWNGEKLRAFRMTHLEGKRSTIAACAKCQYLRGFPPSRDLDDEAQDLLSVYSEAAAGGAGRKIDR